MNNNYPPIYSTSEIRKGEKVAAKTLGISMYELMERAGKAVFQLITDKYSTAQRLLVVCGTGNNGGDGYIVAKLAKLYGYEVILWHVDDSNKVTGDALIAQQSWLNEGGEILPPNECLPEKLDLIIDGMLGTGLSGNVRPQFADIITKINKHSAPVISIDVPSGICADTGMNLGIAIEASLTITFIGLKRGLVSGAGKNFTGSLFCDCLGTKDYFRNYINTKYRLINHKIVKDVFPQRKPNCHKGNFGRVLLVGGSLGMGGAIILASAACARTGAGLTKVVTFKENALSLMASYPEIMTEPYIGNKHLMLESIKWPDTLVLGPGLGMLKWGRELFHIFGKLKLPKVFDADALNFLATQPHQDHLRIITPHPGEAAKLLDCSVIEVEKNRFKATRDLYEKYGGVIILKGSGTIVYNGDTYWVCNQGNPGMATGGMGDVLSGIIGSLLGQKLCLTDAACLGVWLHSNAADQSAQQNGQIGTLASDIFPYIRQLLNEKTLI